jgi:hypothetical protein
MVRDASTVPSGPSTDTAPEPAGPPVAESCTVQSDGWSKVYFTSWEVPEKVESATAVLPPSGVEPDVGPDVWSGAGTAVGSGADVGPAGDGVGSEGFAGAGVGGGAEAWLVSCVPAVGAGTGSPPHEVRAKTPDSAAGRSSKRDGWCLVKGASSNRTKRFP